VEGNTQPNGTLFVTDETAAESGLTSNLERVHETDRTRLIASALVRAAVKILMGGLVAGLAAGIAARVVMRVDSLTDAAPGVQGFTWGGSARMIYDGVLPFFALPAAAAFVSIRRFLPPQSVRAGLLFGITLIPVSFPLLSLASESALIQMLFAGICVGFGVILAVTVGWVDRRLRSALPHRASRALRSPEPQA
jgi:hypothetical protein